LTALLEKMFVSIFILRGNMNDLWSLVGEKKFTNENNKRGLDKVKEIKNIFKLKKFNIKKKIKIKFLIRGFSDFT